MVKNLFLLGLMTWVTLSYAKGPTVVRESMHEAETFKVEKPSQEQDATRAIAGSKIKKQKKSEQKGDGAPEREPSESDSEVRYWQYSE